MSVAFILWCCLPIFCATPQEQSPNDDRTAVETKIADVYAALSSKNYVALRSCFMKDAIMLLPNATIQPSEQVIASFESGKLPAIEESVVWKEVTLYDDIASGWVVTRLVSGKDGSLKKTGLDLFQLVKRDGGWRVAALISTLKTDNLSLPSETAASLVSGIESVVGGASSTPATTPAASEAKAPEVSDAPRLDEVKTDAEPKPAADAPTPAPAPTADVTQEPAEPVAILTTTEGEITIRFFPKDAPEHVKNFIELVRAKLYNGTYFHRVFAGKLIQGGDFNTKDDNKENDGRGGYSYKGPGTKVKFEKNSRTHQRGILSMARSSDPDSAGSQFFISLAPAKGYDGKYTVFGEVVAGLEAADAISQQTGTELKNGGVNPEVPQRITAARIEMWATSRVEAALAERKM